MMNVDNTLSLDILSRTSTITLRACVRALCRLQDFQDENSNENSRLSTYISTDCESRTNPRHWLCTDSFFHHTFELSAVEDNFYRYNKVHLNLKENMSRYSRYALAAACLLVSGCSAFGKCKRNFFLWCLIDALNTEFRCQRKDLRQCFEGPIAYPTTLIGLDFVGCQRLHVKNPSSFGFVVRYCFLLKSSLSIAALITFYVTRTFLSLRRVFAYLFSF